MLVPRSIAVSLLLLVLAVGCSSSSATNECSLQQGLDSMQVLDMSAGIFMFPDFLTAEECDHLVAVSETRFSRSSVVSTEADGKGVGLTHEIRTSSGAAFERAEDEVIKGIEERISRWSLLSVAHQESLQVLKYGAGQQYRPHWDFFQDNTTVQNGGNRHTTVLVYLNDVEEGGETVFPMLPPAPGQEAAGLSPCAAEHLAVKPKKGTALMFRNLTPEGQLETRSLHAGCPVLKGTKYAMAKWIRARPYTTMTEIAARLQQHAAKQRDAQVLAQLAQVLAVAAAR